MTGLQGTYCVGGTDFHALGVSAKHAYYGGALFLKLIQRLNTVISLGQIPRGRRHPRQPIGTWLRAVERIGQASTYGAVFAGQIGDVANAVVIKMNKNPKDSEDLRHEYAVHQVLNGLRAFCPNFVLALGAFACPQLSDELQRIDAPMCSGSGQVVDYIIIERIESVPSPIPGAPGNSWTLFQYLSLGTIDMDVVNSVFAQVMLALHVAQQTMQFTHYDLHLNNVMLQGLHQLVDVADVPTGHAVIHYAVDAGQMTVRGEAIAVLIDFGNARVTRPEDHVVVGGVWQERDGVTPAFSAAYDPFRLVLQVCDMLDYRGIFEYDDLNAWVAAHREYPAAHEDREDLLVLGPGGQPDRAHGLTPARVLQRAMDLYPAFARVVNRAEPGDVHVPLDLTRLATYDCATG